MADNPFAELSRGKTLAEILMKQGTDTSPTPSWGAAIARALQGGLGGYYEKQDRADAASGSQAMLDAIQAIRGAGQEQPSSIADAGQQAPAGPRLNDLTQPGGSVPQPAMARALAGGGSPSPTPPAASGPMPPDMGPGPSTRQGGMTIGNVMSAEPAPDSYHPQDYNLDTMRPPPDKIRLALASALQGQPAPQSAPPMSPPSQAAPMPPQAMPTPQQPPQGQQMAQAPMSLSAPSQGQPPAGAAPPQQSAQFDALRKALANPNLSPSQRQFLLQQATPSYGFQAVGENLVRTDPRSGTATVIPGLSPAKPEYGVIGKDQFGNEQYGWKNPSTRQVTPGPYSKLPDGGSGSSVGAMGAQGQEFLDTLDKPVADQVKAIAEGRMAFPSGFALKTPYWQKMVQMVGQYDPSFDAVNYNARAKTRQDFTSGKSAQSINAMNTVAGHLETLSDAADKLHNTSVPLYNTVTNALSNATGDPRIKQFDATKKAVVDELTRVWRGGGGSEGDIKTWAGAIDAAGSPEQLHGVIGQIGDLVQSKIGAMGEQYKQGMGTTAAPIELVTPKAKAVFDKLRQRASGEAAGQTPTQSDNSGNVETATNPTTGQKIIKKNGQWVPMQ